MGQSVRAYGTSICTLTLTWYTVPVRGVDTSIWSEVLVYSLQSTIAYIRPVRWTAVRTGKRAKRSMEWPSPATAFSRGPEMIWCCCCFRILEVNRKVQHNSRVKGTLSSGSTRMPGQTSTNTIDPGNGRVVHLVGRRQQHPRIGVWCAGAR